MAEVAVGFDWLPVGCMTLDEQGRPLFPHLEAEDLFGVYRLLFEGPPQQVYVGETGRGLRRRWRDYERGAGKSTASRMHVRLLEHATKGAAVHVERMDKVVVMVDGAKTDPALLPLPFLRKLLENAALAQAAVAGLGIVNGDGYPTSPPSAALGSSAR